MSLTIFSKEINECSFLLGHTEDVIVLLQDIFMHMLLYLVSNVVLLDTRVKLNWSGVKM